MDDKSSKSSAPVVSTETVNVTITSIKLKGSLNYSLRAQVVKVYIMAMKKLKYIISDPPASDSSGYEDWMQENAIILIWLWNSMEPNIAANLRRSNKPLQDYYSSFKGLVEELNVFQPLTTDIDKLKEQRNEFFVSKFLAGLDPDLNSIKGHILAGETVPTLADTFSRLQRISSPKKNDSAPKESSAFVVGRGRGHGRSSGRGRGGGGQGPSGQSDWAPQSTNHAVIDGGNDGTSHGNSLQGPMTGSSSTTTPLRDDLSQILRRLQNLEASSHTSTGPSSSSATLAHAGTPASFTTTTPPGIIDTRASVHMTGESSLFTCYSHTQLSSLVILANGSSAPVSGPCTVSPTSSINISSMLHVPQLSLNLLYDLHMRKTIGGGCEKDGLYYLKCGATSFAAATSVGGMTPLQWNKSAFMYFVTFVDDHFRFTWLYLLKDRSKFLSYTQNEISDFCVASGMIHQSSCSYTPEQNGVAERKNIHIFEVARTIMFHMHVLKHFWCEGVLTAYYLINRMPSSVLANKSSFSIIFPGQPIFRLPPRVFGCVYFVQNIHVNSDKLSPRFAKCIFLDYSCTQKGYKYYDPVAHRYFVSADVTFFEGSSYFSSSPFVSRNEWPVVTPPVPILVPFSPPLQVYQRRNRIVPQEEVSKAPTVSPPLPASSSSEALPSSSSNDLPITLRKGTRSYTQRSNIVYSIDKRVPLVKVIYRPNWHMDLVAYSDADWAGSASNRRSTTGYCTFVGGNLVLWHSKKQTSIARSSVEAKYRAMAHTTTELMWLKSLLLEMGFPVPTPMKMYCDNHAAIYIASNLVNGQSILKWTVILFAMPS
ncbi:uncharacterized protein LOC122655212 [Telopea speciosissima]|uniref:uncharacterized protein LOC122655212 n=1 Tax=Telopea speciosissima TaxID=54955 RepID=UPI001CC3677B|nr:uncharacterized protein LOC122655212 [Telopea speciosissima]